MGRTLVDQVIEDAVLECLEGDMSTTLIYYWKKLKRSFFDQRYVDFFLQKGGWMNEKYTLEDAYAFMVLHTHLGTGDLVACDLHIGRTPSSDASVGKNLEQLRLGLSSLVCGTAGIAPPIFDVDLWGGTQGADGELSWLPYLVFDRFKGGKVHESIRVEAKSVPLEVGSQSGAKTMIQLMESRFLARWPYGSDTIRIFCVQKQWWSLDDSLS